MNKKLLFIIFLLLFPLIVKAYDYTNLDTNYKILIEDDASLFNEKEIDSLKEIMIPLTKYGNIALKTIDYNNTSTSSYARNYYHNIFSQKSGTLFLIDMDNRMIYIFSDGNNYKYITSSKADIITDNVYRYASSGNYYECSKEAFLEINTVLEGGKIAEPMRYISNALISVVLAFFGSFIFILSRTKIRKKAANEIIRNCDVSFEVSDINGVKTGTHRVYSPVSSGSSGGGGGSFGGGGSSGGGGGHSF